MPYELVNASASSNAPWTGATWTGATWTDHCCFVFINDIIIYSRNAAEHIYHLRIVLERLSEAGMKIKPDDGKQKSMTYSLESEDSEHSLTRGVKSNTYIIFSVYLYPRFTRWRPIYDIYVLNLILFFFFFFIVIFYCYLELCIYLHRYNNCCIHTTLQGDRILFRLKKYIF